MLAWILVSTAAAGPCPLAVPVGAPPASLREVDWCNRDYQLVSGPLVAGRNEYREYGPGDEGHSTTVSELLDVLYVGDDALVVITETTWLPAGGSFGDGQLVWFAWRDGAPVEVARGDGMPFDRVRLVGSDVEGHWTAPDGEAVARWTRTGDRITLVPGSEVRTPVRVPAPVPAPRRRKKGDRP